MKVFNSVFDSLQPQGQWQGGKFVTYTVVAPAVGQSARLVVPDWFALEVMTVRFSLVTSAAVANRFVAVTYQQPLTAGIASTVPTAQVATTTIDYNFARDFGGVVGTVQSPSIQLPFTMVPPGGVVVVTAVNIDVADQFSGVFITGLAWPLA